MAGTAELLAVLAGQAVPPGLAIAPDHAAQPSHGAQPARTVGLLAAQLADPSVTAQVRDAVYAALDVLAGAGWEIRELAAPWLDQLPRWEETLAVIVAREAYLVHAARDTSRYCEGTRALLDFGAAVTGEQLARALREQAELSAAIEASLAGVDVLAGPTVGYPAPEQDPPFGLGDGNAEGRFTGPYNLTGHPALSMPVPAAGLPVGLQLAGRRGADFALLSVAAAAEQLLADAGHASSTAAAAGSAGSAGSPEAAPRDPVRTAP